jgi:hypothetical protein
LSTGSPAEVIGSCTEEEHPVTKPTSKVEWTVVLVAAVMALGWSGAQAPDWYGIFRVVMMTVGGLVVIALVLIVMVAVISGVMGMIGRLKKKS